MKNGKKQSGK